MAQHRPLFTSESYFSGDMFLTHMKSPNPRGCVLFLHGYPATKQKNYDIAEAFALNGYDVFFPHYSGLGWSKGSFGFEKSRDEILRLVRNIKAENPGCPLSVVGHSWGGLLAIQIADQIDRDLFLLAPLSFIPSEDSGDTENSNYVDLGAFTTFISAIAPKYSSHYSFDELYAEIDRLRINAEKQMTWLMQHKIAITVLHAPADDVIPIKHSREFVQKISSGLSSARLIEVQKEDHTFGNDRSAFLELIQSLVAR